MAVETEGLWLGGLPLLCHVGHECHSPPCCPQCKGWRTRTRTSCRRSPRNPTALTCTTSPNSTWCTRWWRAWRGPSASAWKSRTGRSKVNDSQRAAILGLALGQRILTIFNLDFLNIVLYSPKWVNPKSRNRGILAALWGWGKNTLNHEILFSMKLHLNHHVYFKWMLDFGIIDHLHSRKRDCVYFSRFPQW